MPEEDDPVASELEDFRTFGLDIHHDRELDIITIDSSRYDDNYEASVSLGGLVVDMAESGEILGIEVLGFSKLDFSRKFRSERWKAVEEEDDHLLGDTVKEWLDLRRKQLKKNYGNIVENAEPEDRQDALQKTKGRIKELERMIEQFNREDITVEEFMEKEIENYRENMKD